MLKKKRILICISTSYPLAKDDLSGHFVKRLNQIFIDQSVIQMDHIIILCLDRRSEFKQGFAEHSLEYYLAPTEIRLLPELIEQGIQKIVIPISAFGLSSNLGAPDALSHSPLKSGVGLVLSMYRLWQAYRQLKHCVKSTVHQSYVLAHWAIPSALIARHDQALVYCHGGDVALLESLPFSSIWARYAFQSSKTVVCVSSDLKQRLEKLIFVSKKSQSKELITEPNTELNIESNIEPNIEQQSTPLLKVIPMGIDEPKPCSDTLLMLQDRTKGLIVVSTVGRLVPIKGYDLLLEAFAQLPKELTQRIVWCMAGDGPEREPLVCGAKDHGLNLIALGYIDRHQRDALLAISDLFVAPSRQVGKRVEGAPLALREAALSACRIIATDLGGVASLLDQLPAEAITRVEASVESIAQALESCLTKTMASDQVDQEQQLLRNMQTQAQKLWTWKALTDEHVSTLVAHIN